MYWILIIVWLLVLVLYYNIFRNKKQREVVFLRRTTIKLKDENTTITAHPKNISNSEIASRFIRLYCGEVINSKFIVVGVNIHRDYYCIKSWNSNKNVDVKNDLVINLRDLIGIKATIVVVYDNNIRSILQRCCRYVNLQLLYNIIMSDKLQQTIIFFRKTLEKRWQLIKDCNNKKVNNEYGGYMYYSGSLEGVVGRPLEWEDKTYIVNITRINLLCNEDKFQILLRNLR